MTKSALFLFCPPLQNAETLKRCAFLSRALPERMALATVVLSWRQEICSPHVTHPCNAGMMIEKTVKCSLTVPPDFNVFVASHNACMTLSNHRTVHSEFMLLRDIQTLKKQARAVLEPVLRPSSPCARSATRHAEVVLAAYCTVLMDS